jgi:hypothetical protein
MKENTHNNAEIGVTGLGHDKISQRCKDYRYKDKIAA